MLGTAGYINIVLVMYRYFTFYNDGKMNVVPKFQNIKS